MRNIIDIEWERISALPLDPTKYEEYKLANYKDISHCLFLFYTEKDKEQRRITWKTIFILHLWNTRIEQIVEPMLILSDDDRGFGFEDDMEDDLLILHYIEVYLTVQSKGRQHLYWIELGKRLKLFKLINEL